MPPFPRVVGLVARGAEEQSGRVQELREREHEHQRRDDFYKHGSICEDFDAVEIPSLVIAGWADGYRNTPLKAVEGMGPRAKALIGPWIHKYPHFAWPKPRADFHAEAIRWWNEEQLATDGVLAPELCEGFWEWNDPLREVLRGLVALCDSDAAHDTAAVVQQAVRRWTTIMGARFNAGYPWPHPT